MAAAGVEMCLYLSCSPCPPYVLHHHIHLLSRALSRHVGQRKSHRSPRSSSEPRIYSIDLEEITVRPRFDDVPMLHHSSLLSRHDGVQAMRYDEHGAPAHQSLHSVSDTGLTLRVQVRGR